MAYLNGFEYQSLLIEKELGLISEGEIREGVKVYIRFLLTKIKMYKDDPKLKKEFEESLEQAKKEILTPAEKEAFENLGPVKFAFY